MHHKSKHNTAVYYHNSRREPRVRVMLYRIHVDTQPNPARGDIMPRLNTTTKAQIRVFEALLALTIISIALLTPKPSPIQPNQPSNSAHTILNYIVYTGILQYGLNHPAQLAQTLDAITTNKPWVLQVYSCADNKVILEAQNGEVIQSTSAIAFIYSPTCAYAILQIG